MSEFDAFNIDLARAQRQANNPIYHGNSVIGAMVISPLSLNHLPQFLALYKKCSDKYYRGWIDDVHVRLRVTTNLEWCFDVIYSEDLCRPIRGYYRTKPGARIQYWITYGPNIPSYEFEPVNAKRSPKHEDPHFYYAFLQKGQSR